MTTDVAAPAEAETVSVTGAARMIGVAEPTARRMFDASLPESGTKTFEGGPTGFGERRVNADWARRMSRRNVLDKMDRLARAEEVLAGLARMDPADLAAALGGEPGGVDVYRQRVDRVRSGASALIQTLVRAQTLAGTPRQRERGGQPAGQ